MVTFQRAPINESDQEEYEIFAEYGGGLPIVVVPTWEGVPFGSEETGPSVGRVAVALTQLGLGGGPMRFLLRSEDGVRPAGYGEWAVSLARAIGVPVYLAMEEMFVLDFHDFPARAWREFGVGRGAGPTAMLRYMRDVVTWSLVPESREASLLRGLPEVGQLWHESGASRDRLVIETIVRDGRVRGVVLPTGKDGPVPLRAGLLDGQEIPEGQFVVVAHGGQAVTGLLGQEGPRVPVPPGEMAEIIREAREAGGNPGDTRVVFLVRGLGWRPWWVPAPLHYVRQVATLLGARGGDDREHGMAG